MYDGQVNQHRVWFLTEVIRQAPFLIREIKTDNHITFTTYYTGTHKRSDLLVKSLHALDTFCREQSIPFLPWMPLGDGPLERFDPLCPPIIEAIAAKHGRSTAQVLLASLLQRADVMLPIPGTSSLEHLRENIAAADLVLDDEDMQSLWPSA